MKQIPHRFPVRIYYEDTDAGGIVYHASYLRFMERARTEVLRETGLLQSKMALELQTLFVVGELTVRYLAPARLDDDLIVETTITKIGGASLQMQQNISKRLDNGVQLLLKGHVTLVYITHAGNATRITDDLRAAFLPFLVSKE